MHRDPQRSRWALGPVSCSYPYLVREEADVTERTWDRGPTAPRRRVGGRADEVQFKPSEAAAQSTHMPRSARSHRRAGVAWLSTIAGGNQGTYADRRPQDAEPPRHDVPERLRSLAFSAPPRSSKKRIPNGCDHSTDVRKCRHQEPARLDRPWRHGQPTFHWPRCSAMASRAAWTDICAARASPRPDRRASSDGRRRRGGDAQQLPRGRVAFSRGTTSGSRTLCGAAEGMFGVRVLHRARRCRERSHFASVPGMNVRSSGYEWSVARCGRGSVGYDLGVADHRDMRAVD